MTFKKSIALLLSGSMLATAALTGCGSDNTAALHTSPPNYCQ